MRVTAPARLHLGFLDPSGQIGRRFGSIGLAIDQPATRLTLKRAPAFGASGPESDRALKALRRFAEAFDLEGCFAADIETAIPAHAGLGSGTQLAIAIGAGLMRLAGLPHTSRRLGELVERGARSAIGMAAFEGGGFIIDGGKGSGAEPPPVVVQQPFPQDWRAILILDPNAEGVHGERETRAFAELPPLPQSAAAHLCHLAMMRLLPGLLEHDLPAFGQAVSEIQAVIGEHFAPAQGGSAWASPAVGRLARRLAASGAHGIGQSSWGPTGFAFVSSQGAADSLYPSLVQDAKGEGLEILVARGRNSGASLETLG